MNRNPIQMINEFNRFKNTFQGNPQQEVMKLINSGRISQQQLNQLQSMAAEMQKLLGMR